MNVSHRRPRFRCLVPIVNLVLLALIAPCSAQTCFTTDDMDAATRSALQSTAGRYFDMLARGDTASLQQNSIPVVAAGIENTIKENQANLAGAHATPRAPFLLKAEGTAPIPKAEFLCGIFGANGQTANSAEFVIPNLPPGTYGVVTLDVPTAKSAYTVSFLLQQQGSDWKIGNLFLRPAQIDGHDSKWFLDRARAFKAKSQPHNAWLFLVQGRNLAMPVPFMYTEVIDKLDDEIRAEKPADFPFAGKTADLTSPDGKTYKLKEIFPLSVDQGLDVVVRYEATTDISNTGQTFQQNMAVMKALVTKFPELRDAFEGIVARAVAPSGSDYGSLMPMKDIK